MNVAEVSFEVCNKVGGIHTVISSKAHLMKRIFGNYLPIGYYNEKRSPFEFVEKEIPEYLRSGAEKVEKLGGIVKYGVWLVQGRPNVVLIHPGKFFEKRNEVKYKYWEWYGIDSLRSDNWFNIPITWSYLVGVFLEEVWNEPVIFHEWLSGGALLYLRKNKPEVPTIFHTHATIAGRTLAWVKRDLYEMIKNGISRRETLPDEIAYNYWIEDKHLTEKASAKAAHVFTTVSEITATECEYILGRKPDLVLPNGLDFENVPPIEELSVMHTENEKRINNFVRAFFSPYYTVNTEKMLYFFFSGRPDIRPKGIDILIDALSLVNERLITENINKEVVFFFFIARSDYEKNPEVFENISVYSSIMRKVEKMCDIFKSKVVASIAEGNVPEKILDNEMKDAIRTMVLKLHNKRGNTPPICTHIPSNDDFVYRRLMERGLTNKEGDKIKIIYYPAYLSPGDGLLGLTYKEAITGMHFGIFPSYYEPFGYTALETAAHGVPSLTTDVSGFGKMLINIYGEFCRRMGISVIHVENSNYERIVSELADVIFWLLTMPRRQRLEKKIEAVYMAKHADWRNLINRYEKAVALALQKCQGNPQNG